MPIINAGASATVALAAGQTLAFRLGTGTAQVVPPEPASVAPTIVPVAVGTTVGPFDQAVSVFVVASQLVDYELWQARDVLARDGSLALTAEQAAATRALTAGTVTWANRPTNPALYDQIFVTDIGPNGTQFWWNGSRWKVLYPSVIAQTTTLIAGTAGAADQYFTAARLGSFPVGLLASGDVLQWHIGLGKSGTTDTFGTISLRVGQNGAIGDSAVLTANIAAFMTAASRSGGIEKWLRIESNTTIRGLGVNNANSSWNNVNISGTAADATQVIPNITTTPLFFGISTTMSGGTDTPQIAFQRFTLYP